MAKTLAVMFADSHLQESAWSNMRVPGDAKYALEQIVDYAVKNAVPAVFGAGDLIDKQKNRAGPINFFHSKLDALEGAGSAFYFIEGQHDMDDPPWLAGHRWAQNLDGVTVDIGGRKFSGLSYTPAGLLQERLEEVEADTDVLVAHQVWDDWMGDIANPEGSFADVHRCDAVFTGDLHKFVLEDALGAGDRPMKVCSPGSTCMQDISEPPNKYFVRYTDAGKFVRVPLLSRPVIEFPVIARRDDLDRFADELKSYLDASTSESASVGRPDYIRKPLLRVSYSASLTDAAARIEKLVGQTAYLFLKENASEERQARSSAAKSSAAAGNAVTPSSALADEVDASAEPEVYALCRRLLAADAAGSDPASELSKWKSEFMEVK